MGRACLRRPQLRREHRDPRQLEDPKADVLDIQAAVTAVQAEPQLAGLPVVGLGTCFGAGPMAVAVSQDHRLRAYASVAGVYTDGAATRAAMGDAYDQVLDRGRAAELRWRQTGVPETISAVARGGGDVAMPLREAYEFYGTPRGAVPNYVNGFAVASYLHTLPFDAQRAAPALGAPAILVHSERALAPAWAHRFHDTLDVPKCELWTDSQGRIDFYDDPRLVGVATDAVVDFLDEHLAVA